MAAEDTSPDVSKIIIAPALPDQLVYRICRHYVLCQSASRATNLFCLALEHTEAQQIHANFSFAMVHGERWLSFDIIVMGEAELARLRVRHVRIWSEHREDLTSISSDGLVNGGSPGDGWVVGVWMS